MVSIPRNRALNGNMYVEIVHNLTLTCNKVIRKIKKRPHWNIIFSHIGDEISKNGGKKYIGFQQGMKLNLNPYLVLN
jgi:hypothetical protein